MADLYAAALNKTDRLSIIDAYIQRIVYVTKYSKRKNKDVLRLKFYARNYYYGIIAG